MFINCSGALGTRLSVDALNVRRLAGDNLALIVQSIASLTTGFVIAFAADWRLALIITCVIPLVGAQGYAQVKFLKGFSEDAKVMNDNCRNNFLFYRVLYFLMILELPIMTM